MFISNKAPNELTAEDIQALIDNQVPESRTIDYKEAYKLDGDDDKREFLYDVTSFANTSGGDIVFGIKEKRENNKPTGLPDELVGLESINVDAEKRRISQLVSHSVRPRIAGIEVEGVDLGNGKVALVIHIPKSWSLPHMVTHSNVNKFYGRSSTNKDLLDVDQIRALFMQQESTAEKLRAMRLDRIEQLRSDEGPIGLPSPNPSFFLLQLVPISAISSTQTYEISRYFSNFRELRPFHGGSGDYRYNFDGLLTFCPHAKFQNRAYGFTQLHRNGIIESITSGFTSQGEGDSISIPSTSFEGLLIERLGGYLRILQQLEIVAPIALLSAFVGVNGAILSVNGHYSHWGQYNIDRTDLLFPEILIEDYSKDPAAILRPLFDALWNAGGYERSFNYDPHGNWNPK